MQVNQLQIKNKENNKVYNYLVVNNDGVEISQILDFWKNSLNLEGKATEMRLYKSTSNDENWDYVPVNSENPFKFGDSYPDEHGILVKTNEVRTRILVSAYILTGVEKDDFEENSLYNGGDFLGGLTIQEEEAKKYIILANETLYFTVEPKKLSVIKRLFNEGTLYVFDYNGDFIPSGQRSSRPLDNCYTAATSYGDIEEYTGIGSGYHTVEQNAKEQLHLVYSNIESLPAPQPTPTRVFTGPRGPNDKVFSKDEYELEETDKEIVVRRVGDPIFGETNPKICKLLRKIVALKPALYREAVSNRYLDSGELDGYHDAQCDRFDWNGVNPKSSIAIEFETQDYNSDVFHRIAHWFDGHMFVLGEDSTVEAEINTPPQSIEIMLLLIEAMKEAGFTTDETCGNHIHFTRDMEKEDGNVIRNYNIMCMLFHNNSLLFGCNSKINKLLKSSLSNDRWNYTENDKKYGGCDYNCIRNMKGRSQDGIDDGVSKWATFTPYEAHDIGSSDTSKHAFFINIQHAHTYEFRAVGDIMNIDAKKIIMDYGNLILGLKKMNPDEFFYDCMTGTGADEIEYVMKRYSDVKELTQALEA